MKLQSFLIITSVLLLFLGMRFFYVLQQKDRYDKKPVAIEFILMSPPQILSNRQVIVYSFGFGKKIRIITPLYPAYEYGDTIRVEGELQKVKRKISNQSLQLLNKDSIDMTIYFPKIKKEKNPFQPGLAIILFIRQNIISLFQSKLPYPFSSLMLGIVFGIKETMPKELSERLSQLGLTHIIAASGMNVSLLSGFLYSLYTVFLNRKVSILLIMISIIFYSILCGLAPSIIRAGIMGCLLYGAQFLGRQSYSLFALFLAGYGMLFVAPGLLFDIGFQLSFLSTLSLLFVFPLLQKAKETLPVIKTLIFSDFLTTISVQIATVPIVLYYFGVYSPVSILANMVILWIIPILMNIGLVAASIGLLFPFFASFILYFSLPFLFYFQWVSAFFSSLIPSVPKVYIPFQMVVGYYGILVAFLVFFHKEK